ncbi:MAG: hypothetical protein JEZ08_22520 [Clostridiales bacterium]|nr:hypothetical protein [Clostridiales bacterium]
MIDYDYKYDNLMFKGVRNVDKIPFVDYFERDKDAVLLMMYLLELSTIQQLCFMLNMNYAQVSDAIGKINAKANGLKRNKKAYKHEIMIDSKSEEFYGRNRAFYWLEKVGRNYVENRIMEERKENSFMGKRFHFNEAGFLFARLFKNSYDINIKREVPIYDKNDDVMIRSDVILKYNIDETHSHELIIEQDNASESAYRFNEKMDQYGSILLFKKGLIIVATFSRGKKFHLKYNSYHDDEMKWFKARQKEYKSIRSHVSKIVELAHEYNDSIKVVMNLFGILIGSDYEFKRLDEEEIGKFKRIENDYFVFKKLYDQDPDNLSNVRKINAYYKYLTSRIQYQTEKHAIHEATNDVRLIVNNRKQRIFESKDYLEVPAKDLVKLPISNLSQYTLNHDKYVVPSFKKSLLVNEFFADAQYDIGDFFELLFSSMKDIKSFFEHIFYPNEEIQSFKYEPVHYSVDGELNTKNIFSATGIVNGKREGMIIFSPTVCLSDELRLDLLEQNMFKTEHEYNEIKYLVLKDEDIFGVVRTKRTSAIRDYTDVYVNYYLENEEVDTEKVDLSWLGSDVIERVKAM